MQAYEMDDEPTIYAANSAWEAANIYVSDTGEKLEAGYPRMLTDSELDAEFPDYDEDERLTGATTTIRRWLEAATEPGFLAGAMISWASVARRGKHALHTTGKVDSTKSAPLHELRRGDCSRGNLLPLALIH